jgi:hypothetical protein
MNKLLAMLVLSLSLNMLKCESQLMIDIVSVTKDKIHPRSEGSFTVGLETGITQVIRHSTIQLTNLKTWHFSDEAYWGFSLGEGADEVYYRVTDAWNSQGEISALEAVIFLRDAQGHLHKSGTMEFLA